MFLETLQCAAVAAATIIIEHKKKRNRKRWVASFVERRNRNLNILGEPFYYQLMHIMLKNTELLKHSKISIPSHSARYTRLTGHNMQP